MPAVRRQLVVPRQHVLQPRAQVCIEAPGKAREDAAKQLRQRGAVTFAQRKQDGQLVARVDEDAGSQHPAIPQTVPRRVRPGFVVEIAQAVEMERGVLPEEARQLRPIVQADRLHELSPLRRGKGERPLPATRQTRGAHATGRRLARPGDRGR